jgi:hypothetical protein
VSKDVGGGPLDEVAIPDAINCEAAADNDLTSAIRFQRFHSLPPIFGSK